MFLHLYTLTFCIFHFIFLPFSFLLRRHIELKWHTRLLFFVFGSSSNGCQYVLVLMLFRLWTNCLLLWVWCQRVRTHGGAMPLLTRPLWTLRRHIIINKIINNPPKTFISRSDFYRRFTSNTSFRSVVVKNRGVRKFSQRNMQNGLQLYKII